jgi:hypothetical protein
MRRFVERSGLRLSNQYILVTVIPSCFRSAKMCLCQVSLQSRCDLRYLTSNWGELHVAYTDRRARLFRVMNVTWIDLDPLAFILHFEIVSECK